MNSHSCQKIRLDLILNDDCDQRTESEIQAHLDNCPTCQQRLEALAADPITWSDAADHLSSSSELVLNQDVESKLAQTQTAIVLSRHPELTDSVEADYTDNWQELLDAPPHPRSPLAANRSL